MKDVDGNLWKGAVAGLAAGLAATFVMTQFQTLSGKLEEALEAKKGDKKEKKGDDATVKAASAISRGVFHHTLTREEKKVAGPAVHYGFGTLTGGMYGALAELTPAVTRGAGLPFGTALWLGADEVAVPAFRLSEPAAAQPQAVHAKALAAHWVYGLAMETARRLVRRVL
ncbi:MAG TPA: DUF1440 domain-containing protein [Thermoanaerobaculia bacterium]|jgi:uncharacterized membrane protein YagU involved in acid resistance|nr:DUF1440 domain-containing protein [Thermoanaerobaculia bacterium]